MNDQIFRSGFVSLIGQPNAGKSTLLNALVGAKVAIVADKPQTTRSAIQGVLTTDHAQVVFIDTPGIHKADSPINRHLMKVLRSSLDERDLLLFVTDASLEFRAPDRHALDLVKKWETPAILVLNKIDLLRDRTKLLKMIESYRVAHDFSDYVPISAAKGENVDVLREAIITRMPEGPAYFPREHISDQPERFLAAELIREKILAVTRQEVPHSVAVLVDNWDDTPTLLRVYATIYVERQGQKGIIIGAGGSNLKQVGTNARQEMERIFGKKVFIDLHVKVEPGWKEKSSFLDTLDWRTMAGKDES